MADAYSASDTGIHRYARSNMCAGDLSLRLSWFSTLFQTFLEAS